MDIFSQIVLLFAGFALLFKGAGWIVSGATSVAAHYKVSKRLIGLTIVAFGTGAPEIAIGFSALITGNTDMLIGDVIGSNILNVLLLIGIAALIRPIKINKNTISKELPLLFLITLSFAFLFLDTSLTGGTFNAITRSDGLVCLLFFAVFLYYIISMSKKNRKQKKVVEKPKFTLGKSYLYIIIGLASIILGSQLVINSANTIATVIGISDRIIALTVIALGTSLPDLATTITAAKRGENELLVGNVIGTSIFNICIVLGLPVAIFGTVALENFQILDIVVLIISAALLWIFARDGSQVSRREGILMLAIFIAYNAYLLYGALA
ncbi:MAG: calcium/sodium antiporter [Candidatus Saccharibacteria bacterium]|nr:calcium/sodium antiporter [Candidatus Saccharibacteria bacterium]